MTKLGPLNDILNDTPADATYVDQNYDSIRNYVNNELINADGSVSMAAPLHLVGDPTNPLDAATKSYVDAVLPVGIMMPWGGIEAPSGEWLLCNGATLSKALYPKLFPVLEYKFGGSGANFMLPNLVGRVIVGYDPGKAEFNAVGKSGGTWVAPVPSHQHNMPHTHDTAHTHPIPHTHAIDHNHLSGTTSASGGHSHTVTASNNPTGLANGLLGRTVGGTQTNYGTDTEPAHTHTLDLGLYTGSSGSASTQNSGAQSQATSTQPSAVATALFGTVGAEHIAPYLTMHYIIRAG